MTDAEIEALIEHLIKMHRDITTDCECYNGGHLQRGIEAIASLRKERDEAREMLSIERIGHEECLAANAGLAAAIRSQGEGA